MDTKKYRVDELFQKGLAELEIGPTVSGQAQFMKDVKK